MATITPASPASLAALSPPSPADSSEEVCSICLLPLNGDKPLSAHLANNGNNAHLFHEACAIRWIRLNPTCPDCRSPFPLYEAVSTEESRGKLAIEAARKGEITTLRKVLQSGSISDEDRGIACIQAVIREDLGGLKELLRSGQIPDALRGKAVIGAASMRACKIVERLLSSGNISRKDRRDALRYLMLQQFPRYAAIAHAVEGKLNSGFSDRIAIQYAKDLELLNIAHLLFENSNELEKEVEAICNQMPKDLQLDSRMNCSCFGPLVRRAHEIGVGTCQKVIATFERIRKAAGQLAGRVVHR